MVVSESDAREIDYARRMTRLIRQQTDLLCSWCSASESGLIENCTATEYALRQLVDALLGGLAYKTGLEQQFGSIQPTSITIDQGNEQRNQTTANTKGSSPPRTKRDNVPKGRRSMGHFATPEVVPRMFQHSSPLQPLTFHLTQTTRNPIGNMPLLTANRTLTTAPYRRTSLYSPSKTEYTRTLRESYSSRQLVAAPPVLRRQTIVPQRSQLYGANLPVPLTPGGLKSQPAPHLEVSPRLQNLATQKRRLTLVPIPKQLITAPPNPSLIPRPTGIEVMDQHQPSVPQPWISKHQRQWPKRKHEQLHEYGSNKAQKVPPPDDWPLKDAQKRRATEPMLPQGPRGPRLLTEVRSRQRQPVFRDQQNRK